MALDEYDSGREGVFPSARPRPVESPRSWRRFTTTHPQRIPAKRATCSVMSHWGEVIQGPVMFEERPHIGLVTLPDPAHYVTASASRARTGADIASNPPWKAKALHAAQLVLARWAPGLGVDLHF